MSFRVICLKSQFSNKAGITVKHDCRKMDYMKKIE